MGGRKDTKLSPEVQNQVAKSSGDTKRKKVTTSPSQHSIPFICKYLDFASAFFSA